MFEPSSIWLYGVSIVDDYQELQRKNTCEMKKTAQGVEHKANRKRSPISWIGSDTASDEIKKSCIKHPVHYVWQGLSGTVSTDNFPRRDILWTSLEPWKGRLKPTILYTFFPHNNLTVGIDTRIMSVDNSIMLMYLSAESLLSRK